MQKQRRQLAIVKGLKTRHAKQLLVELCMEDGFPTEHEAKIYIAEMTAKLAGPAIQKMATEAALARMS